MTDLKIIFRLFDLRLSSFRSGVIFSSRGEEITRFLIFRLLVTWVLRFNFLLFSQMLAV